MEIAPPRASRSLLWIVFSALLFLAMLAGGLFFSGCAAPVPVPPPALPPAHLVVINETDYEWQLTVTRVSGKTAQAYRLQSRATLSLELTGGDYEIEQTALSENPAPELSRKLPVRLDSNQTYRWRLMTLLSEPTAPADYK